MQGSSIHRFANYETSAWEVGVAPARTPSHGQPGCPARGGNWGCRVSPAAEATTGTLLPRRTNLKPAGRQIDRDF
jgi:hypothetical protein